MRLIELLTSDPEGPRIVEGDDGLRVFVAKDVQDEDVVDGAMWSRADTLGCQHFYNTETDDWNTFNYEHCANLGGFPTYDYLLEFDREMADIAGVPYSDFVHLHTHSEYCLAPETKVVTADLLWKRIDEVVVGEELVGFGEDLRPPEGQRGVSRSKMERTTVIATKRVNQPCYQITLEDGSKIVASELHGWVANGTTLGSQVGLHGPKQGYGTNTRRWITTKQIKPGKTRLIKWARPWISLETEQVRDGAWLAGIADGEGWLRSSTVSFGQNPGFVWDEILRVCQKLEYPTTPPRIQGPKGKCLTTSLLGYETALRFLSQCAPIRFANRTDALWVGKRAGSRHTRPVLVTDVQFLGDRETIALQTTTATFVAEGFLSHNSAFDGLSTVEEIVQHAVDNGQRAVAITDHGVCASHPHLQRVAAEAGIKPIYGIEAYFSDDRFRRPKGWEGKSRSAMSDAEKAEYDADMEEAKQSYHLILWAQTDQGLKNLWAMSTEANRTGFYYKPRMDWALLEQYNEGVMCSTGCLGGLVGKAINETKDVELARLRMARLKGIFGDRLYAEIHTNTMPEQRVVNETTVQLAKELTIPVIAVDDSHFSCPEHHDTHKVWIAAKTSKSLSEKMELFADEGGSYHMQTEQEVRKALSYLPDEVVENVINNTGRVADRITAQLVPKTTKPVFSKRGGVVADRDLLLKMCKENWKKTYGKLYEQGDYLKRFEEEANLIIDKEFCGYFLIVADYVGWAKRHGILVGPGRGSGAGSLVAYLMGITEIDPVEANLLFARFMTKGRKELPDFDIDFPSSKMEEVFAYISDKWGEDRIVRIGTHTRLKNKGVMEKMFQVFRKIEEYKDIPFMVPKNISDIITKAEAGTAGLGLSWDELWDMVGDELAQYRLDFPEIFAHADIMVGRLSTYGKHAAGVVISTDAPLTDVLPLRVGDKEADNQLVSEFAMDDLAYLGYIKFDFLGVTALDMLQDCVNLVKERTGKDIDLYAFRDEYHDDKVWDALGKGQTLGCFQIETDNGRRMTLEVQPRNLNDLSDVTTIDRPGPMRSGLDKIYLARRHGNAKVVYDDPRLESVLGATYGCMLYQEDIMATCMVLAGYDDEEADYVRKILGKKKVELVEAERAKFSDRAIRRGMDPEAVETLWKKMAEFARYSFNRAHAYSYVTISYWSAYLKVNYPLEFLVAVMSNLKDDVRLKRIGSFIMDAQQRGYSIVPPDINRSGRDFAIDDEEIVFGFEAIRGIGESAAEAIVKDQPYTSYQDFMDRCTVNVGVTDDLIRVGAFNCFEPNRRVLEKELARQRSGALKRCVDFNPTKQGAPNNLPCNFDWENEPLVIGKSGKPLARKPPPKKCTVACRNYRQCTPDPLDAEPYTDKEIRDLEAGYLGVYLSSTPFDHINEKFGSLPKFSDFDHFSRISKTPFAAVVTKVAERKDRRKESMGFVNLFVQDGDIRAVCFASDWSRGPKLKNVLKEGRLVLGYLSKTDRGYQILSAMAADETTEE